MEKIELLSAEMARELSNKKPFSINDVLASINQNAINGGTFVKYFDIEFTPQLLKEIINLGYEISANKDPFGVLVTKISW